MCHGIEIVTEIRNTTTHPCPYTSACPSKPFHYIFATVYSSDPYTHFFSPPNRSLPIVNWPPTPSWNRLASSSAFFVLCSSLAGHSCSVQFYGVPSQGRTACVLDRSTLERKRKKGTGLNNPALLPSLDTWSLSWSPLSDPSQGHLSSIILLKSWGGAGRTVSSTVMQYLGMTCISIHSLGSVFLKPARRGDTSVISTCTCKYVCMYAVCTGLAWFWPRVRMRSV